MAHALQGGDVSSQADYLLAREGNRRDVWGVALKALRHHDSDHQAVIATVDTGSADKLARYRRKRHCCLKKAP